MGVLQVFSSFFVEATATGPPEPGDIYWVPVPSTDEVPRVLDVKRADPHRHDEIEYEIREIQPYHFTERSDRLPLKLIHLEAAEELLIARCKKRPAVVLIVNRAASIEGAGPLEQRLAKAATKASYVVAPLYSTATPQSPGTFMPVFVARIRALRYPQFACLPRLGSNEPVPGEIVRLDRLYSTHLSRGCDRGRWKLHPELLRLLHDQLAWAATGTLSEYLKVVAETASDALPPECA